MAYDMVRIDRGQVWVVRFKYPEANGHEIQKDRPWLVLSVGKFNSSSGMVTCAPLSTQDSVRTPTQVLIGDLRGATSVIICEQIRTFDYKSGAYIFDYMGTVSDEIMEKVDVALSIHLGMHYSPITLNKLYSSMEAIIKSVTYMQEKDNSPKFTDEDVLMFASKLESLAASHNEVSVSVEESYTHNGQIVQNVMTDTEDTNDVKETVRPKSKRISWSRDVCESFLHDVDTMSVKEVMTKWEISKRTRYYSMRNYAESLLKKMNSKA